MDHSQAFLEEVQKETRLGKFTFAELEEIDDDFAKLSSWLGKIEARDFFSGKTLKDARAIVGMRYRESSVRGVCL